MKPASWKQVLWFFATLGLSLAFSLASSIPGQPVPQESSARLTLLVPSYFYPSGKGLKEWDRLLRSPGLDRLVVILNPASGPGAAADENYTRLLERIGRTRLTTIGYVSTSYAKRSLNEVKADVDRWLKFYPSIQGIFFDEQHSAASFTGYYRELHDYVRKTKGLALTITNPGTTCDEAFFARPSSDAICFYEGKRWPGSSNIPSWGRQYPRSTKCVLPYDVGTSKRMKEILKSAAAAGIGRIYVTDASGVNPWNRLPRYWEDEVVEIARIDGEL